MKHREEIEFFKIRVVSVPLKPENKRTSSPLAGPEIVARNTRFPRNSNRHVEMLCDMTCDLDYGMQTANLTEAEKFALISVPFLEDQGLDISTSAYHNFENGLEKLYYMLNYGIQYDP